MTERAVRSLTVAIAAFDEEEALPACVSRTLAFLREHVPEHELILVDDGSMDETGRLVDGLAASEPEVLAFHLPRNRGMGAALLRAYAAATMEWVTMLPADGQIDPYDLLLLCAAAEDADLVTSVYTRRRYPIHRRVLSTGLRLLSALVVGTRVRMEGTYLIRRAVLEALGARSESFLLNLEIPIRAMRAGYRIRTVTIPVHERIGGRSKAATPGRIARTLADQLALRVRLAQERPAVRRGDGGGQGEGPVVDRSGHRR